MTIRQFNRNDAPAVQDFYNAMGPESSAFFNVNRGNEKRTMGYFDGTTKNTLFFMAEEDNICEGLMFIWDLEKSVPWFGIAVRDGCQGKGIGTKMIDFLRNYLAENNYGGLLLRTAVTNNKAQHLYEKCGFERIGTHPSGEYLYILRLENGGNPDELNS